MLYEHKWEVDSFYNHVCTKCGGMRNYFNWDAQDCPKADDVVKEPYVDNTDYSKLSNEEIRRMLGGGNRGNDIER